METLKDGKDGFNSAAELLEDNSRSELASQFREFSQQRGRFYQQLETLAAEYGDDLEVSGSLAGKLHQALMSVRDCRVTTLEGFSKPPRVEKTTPCPPMRTPWSKTSHQCSAPLFSANSVKFEQLTTG